MLLALLIFFTGLKLKVNTKDIPINFAVTEYGGLDDFNHRPAGSSCAKLSPFLTNRQMVQKLKMNFQFLFQRGRAKITILYVEKEA